MQPYLIATDEVSKLARTMSVHIDTEKIETYIRESENIDLKSALGDTLFLDVKDHPDNYSELLNGGSYNAKCGGKRFFVGLKTALAYYTYARMVKNGDGNVTRFGFMNKGNEYSSHSDFKEKLMAYNDAFSMADQYLKECVRYLNDNRESFPLYRGNGGLTANRVTCRILGE